MHQDTREVEILANELGKKTTPSWVGFSSQNGKQIIVGENARDQETWVYDAKRMIGRAIGDEALQAHFRLWDFKVEESEQGTCQISLPDGNVMSIEQISGIVLQAMKKIVEKRVGYSLPKLKAVVTVPAYFDSQQKEATQYAAEIAGLEVLRMISEPTAAVMAAKFDQSEQDRNVLVFDIGGGTYDLSVLSIAGKVLSVEATAGLMNLGGRDLDEVLTDYCLHEFNKQTSLNLTLDKPEYKRARHLLSLECEKAKIKLQQTETADENVQIKLQRFYADQDLEVHISRE